MDVRRRARAPRQAVAATAGVLLLLVAARAVAWLATAPFPDPRIARTAPDGAAARVCRVAAGRSRRAPARRQTSSEAGRAAAPGRSCWTAIVYAAVGAAGASILWAYEKYLRSFVTQSTLDLTHFSLHPLIPSRLALAFGLVLLHVAVVWSVVLLLRLAAIEWRRPRSAALRPWPPSRGAGGLALAIVDRPPLVRRGRNDPDRAVSGRGGGSRPAGGRPGAAARARAARLADRAACLPCIWRCSRRRWRCIRRSTRSRSRPRSG